MSVKTYLLSLLAAAMFVLAGAACAQQPQGDPRVRVVTTAGDFVIRLDPDRAPLTVAAFLEHVDNGFYEGTVFHRVIAGFVAQGGGYDENLELKPTEATVANESGNGLSNMRGTVGLARTTEPHSGTTQFYVNLADNLDLNPRPSRWGYAVFGTIEEGMEVVDSIGHSPTSSGGQFTGNVPVTPIVIERIERITE
ncbi:MAG: peptidylprolyl isomerase [Gammaproteobacteria bacterium]|jgi:cyclophilin family peptidyl-prolyl cis-trans isomerase